MVITYKKALEKYKSKYRLQQAVDNKEIFKIQKGYYSESEYYNQVEYIMVKYPNIIFTNQSAYMYLGFSDFIPDRYYVATKQKARKIHFSDIKQIYESKQFYGLGKTVVNHDGIEVPTYDKERMLIELIRNQNTFPFDYYKEIITIYREEVTTLDMDKIMDYLEVFSNSNQILEKLNKEVF